MDIDIKIIDETEAWVEFVGGIQITRDRQKDFEEALEILIDSFAI